MGNRRREIDDSGAEKVSETWPVLVSYYITRRDFGGKRGTMLLELKGRLIIENLQNYPAETVAKLRALLAVGAVAWPDPRRKNFYDVENGSHVFYIHLTPSGKVLLLADCPKVGRSAAVPETELAS